MLGENPRAVAALRWLYRWPLFIPFVVAGQLMRTFLAKNGMMNNTLRRRSACYEPLAGAELPRLARHRRHLRLEADAVRGAAGRGRHGLARPRDHRGRAQPRRRPPARPARDRRAAGPPDARGRPDPVVRDHDVGALGAADDQRPDADHADRRHGVSDQRLRRLRRRQRAGLHLLPDDRSGRLDLPAPGRARRAAADDRLRCAALRRLAIGAAARPARLRDLRPAAQPRCSGRSPRSGTSRTSCRWNTASRSGSGCSGRAATRWSRSATASRSRCSPSRSASRSRSRRATRSPAARCRCAA